MRRISFSELKESPKPHSWGMTDPFPQPLLDKVSCSLYLVRLQGRVLGQGQEMSEKSLRNQKGIYKLSRARNAI